MRIGLIGAGNIGGAVARLALSAGHDVVLSNSRGPETLAQLVAELGDRASAATAAEAATGDLVVVSIPLRSYPEVPVPPAEGTIVVDTNNYYPARDGRFAELDDGTTTSSELLARHLPGARVVKAFNSIQSGHLISHGQPPGTPGRRALPIAGDDGQAKRAVIELIDSFGFDVVDAGPLASGRLFEPGTPAYGPRLDARALQQALAAAG